MEQKNFVELLYARGSWYRLMQKMSKNIVIVYPNYEEKEDIEENSELNLEKLFESFDDE